jgi:hydrogenase maturation protease
MGESNMATIIIGIGNPVLTDDSVGLQVVRELNTLLSSHRDVTTRELCAGGLRLVEAMAGYERAIIIDAIVSEEGQPGSVCVLEPSDVKASKNTCSTHDASLNEALELGKMAGLALPEEIRIWAIEAGDVETFSESLTEQVQHAVPKVVESVMQHLAGNPSLPA